MATGFEPIYISEPSEKISLSGNPIVVKFEMEQTTAIVSAPGILKVCITTQNGIVEHIERRMYGADRIVEFDISELFDKKVNPQIFFDGSSNKWCIESVIEYSIQVGVDLSNTSLEIHDYSTGELVIITEVYADAKSGRVVPGGFPNLFLDYMNGQLDFDALYCTAFNNGSVNKFFTSQPNNRSVSPTQSNRLYFWAINVPEATWKIEGVVTYADGEEVAYANTIVTAGPVPNSIPCGLSELVPVLEEDHGLVISYTVKITYNAEDYTETRTFNIDNKYYENQTLIFVENSKGAYDALWFTGAIKKSSSYTFDIQERIATYINGGRYGTGRSQAVTRFIVNTGNKSRSELRAMNDALVRRRFFMPFGKILIPGFINNNEFTYSDSEDDLLNANIELVLGYKESFWDDYETLGALIGANGAFSDGFNNGFFI